MSLLLDALRQAEKNKAGQTPKIEHSEFEIQNNSTQQTVNNDLEETELVELDILPEYELELTKQAVNDSDDLQEITLAVDNYDSGSIQDIDNEEAGLEKQTLQEDAFTSIIEDKPETNLVENNLDLPDENLSKQAENNNNTSVADENIQTNLENDISQTDQAVLSESEEISLDEETVNIIQTSNDTRNNTTIWIVIIFLIGLLAVAGYLYSLTIIPTIVPTEAVDIDADPLVDVQVEEANNLANTNLEIETTEQSAKVTLETPQPDSVPKINTSPQEKLVNITKPQSKPKVNPQVLSEFIVETNENSIDYPKKIRIKVKRQQPAMFRILESAYSAYSNQKYIVAADLYQQVLRQDSTNKDALLGLGAIAEQYRDIQRAQLYYQRILRVDSNHVVAQNALIRLHKSENPTENESRYRNQLEKFPDSAETYAALANSYAVKGQWNKAQKAYFNAVERNPESAEYQYNLAVSLEHLAKKSIALAYYQKALQLGKNLSTNFDKTLVKQRIQQLKED